jgi:hypothetical protein
VAQTALHVSAVGASADTEPAELDSGIPQSNLIRGCLWRGRKSKGMGCRCHGAGGGGCIFDKLTSRNFVFAHCRISMGDHSIVLIPDF